VGFFLGTDGNCKHTVFFRPTPSYLTAEHAFDCTCVMQVSTLPVLVQKKCCSSSRAILPKTSINATAAGPKKRPRAPKRFRQEKEEEEDIGALVKIEPRNEDMRTCYIVVCLLTTRVENLKHRQTVHSGLLGSGALAGNDNIGYWVFGSFLLLF